MKPSACGKIVAAALAALALADCAGQTGASGRGSSIDPKLGVAPSPRVVADGEPVPHGGGNYMVGKPYTIAGNTYYPSEKNYSAVGTASWYGSDFHGRRTANGEIFDKMSFSAAHPTMPLPSYARVTNIRNHRSIIVRVNDRGPYHGGRVMDVSSRVADALDFKRTGTARVKVEYIGKAGLGGSDDNKLAMTLRTDGTPATLDGGSNLQPLLAQRSPESDLPSRQQAAAVANEPRAEQDETVVATNTPQVETKATRSVAAVEPVVKPIAMAHIPVPPARPFDLGTIPGAGVPLSVTMTSHLAYTANASAPAAVAVPIARPAALKMAKPQPLSDGDE